MIAKSPKSSSSHVEEEFSWNVRLDVLDELLSVNEERRVADAGEREVPDARRIGRKFGGVLEEEERSAPREAKKERTYARARAAT